MYQYLTVQPTFHSGFTVQRSGASRSASAGEPREYTACESEASYVFAFDLATASQASTQSEYTSTAAERSVYNQSDVNPLMSPSRPPTVYTSLEPLAADFARQVAETEFLV